MYFLSLFMCQIVFLGGWLFFNIVGWVGCSGGLLRVVPCVRSCVRAVRMPSGNQMRFKVLGFPFSLLARDRFPSRLWDLVSPRSGPSMLP